MCKKAKEEFFVNDLNEIKNLKRSKDDQLKQLEKVKEKKFGVPAESVEGYLHSPILSFISYDDIIFDTLHLSLRLPGKLIKLIYSELSTLDGLLDEKRNTTNLEETKYQKQFFVALEQIGIKDPYSYIKNEETNQVLLKIRTFNGDESLLIMEKLNFEVFFPLNSFPEFTKGKDFTQLCKNFYDIFFKMKNKNYIDNVKQCEKETGDWLTLFLKLFHSKHVTPYTHLFVGHLAQFIQTYGDVDVYNIQGLEKLNDLTTKQYHRATNRKSFATYQMLVYRLRREFNDDYEEIKPRPINKRYKTKQIRDEIKKEELKKSWVEFNVNGIKLKNSDINNMGTVNFSVKVSIFHFMKQLF